MNSRATPTVAVAETPPGVAAADAVNPSERIRIANPPAGTYVITVTGASVLQGQQGFALAASGRVSAVGSSFTPGPARQRDVSGTPTISNVKVEPISSNTAIVRFTTNEPTTATATAGGNTYVDSYNVGSGGFPGLNEATIETSTEYGDKPVVGTSHEILMTALSPGQSYSIALAARDLASNTRNASVTHTSPALAYQADAPDIGYFSSGPNGAAQFRTGTQMYAGTAFVDPLDTVAQRHLGAWMFRVPQTVDPNTITGAVVETTSRHNWVVQYTADPQFTVDLLNETVEPNWGTQNYDAIRTAPHTARVFPETGYERGGGQTYAFTFNCSDIAALRSSLSTVDGGERKAAFRYEATQTEAASLFSMDFGFNRRSSGPAYRPRLLLFTGTSYPTGEGCDANAPAPVINDIGIQDGLTDGSVTVTWRTDNVASDSMVLFRERGTTQWTQVGTPARTRVHQVQVHGLDSTKFYEFVVRSRACNGATTTDTNNGAGYDFFRHAPDPGPRTQHGPTFDFESGAQGWTVASSTQDQAGLASQWTLDTTGAEGAANKGWHVASTITGVHSYHNHNETTLTAPAPVTFGGALASVEFSLALDTEPTFDFLYVEYSTNGGASWTEAAHFDGNNGHPAYSPTDARFGNPGGPVLVRFRFKSDELLSSPAVPRRIGRPRRLRLVPDRTAGSNGKPAADRSRASAVGGCDRADGSGNARRAGLRDRRRSRNRSVRGRSHAAGPPRQQPGDQRQPAARGQARADLGDRHQRRRHGCTRLADRDQEGRDRPRSRQHPGVGAWAVRERLGRMGHAAPGGPARHPRDGGLEQRGGRVRRDEQQPRDHGHRPRQPRAQRRLRRRRRSRRPARPLAGRRRRQPWSCRPQLVEPGRESTASAACPRPGTAGTPRSPARRPGRATPSQLLPARRSSSRWTSGRPASRRPRPPASSTWARSAR